MKKIIACFSLILVTVLTLVSPTLALVKKSDSFYVADYANVLSDSTEQNIINANAALEHYTGGQIVVVTVKYLDGLNSDEYAVRLMNEWGVGDAKKNNGMLLLLATQENKAWLTQGAGISGAFTDSKIDSLLNKYFWKDFDKEKYDDAVNSLFKQLIGWYESYYKVDITNGNSISPSSGDSSIFYALSWKLITAAIVLFLIFYFSARSAGRRRYYRDAGPDYPGPRPRPFIPFIFFGNPFGYNRHRHDDFNNRGRWGGWGRGGGGGGFGGGGFGGGGFGGGGGGHSGGGGGGRR